MVGRRRGCSGVAVRLMLFKLADVSLSWTLGLVLGYTSVEMCTHQIRSVHINLSYLVYLIFYLAPSSHSTSQMLLITHVLLGLEDRIDRD